MKVFIVYAHHEQRSFNAALLERSVATLSELGHDVRGKANLEPRTVGQRRG